MARELLSSEERQRIADAVAAAEARTAGEIVPVVVRTSDTYPGARWRLAVVFALGLATVLAAIVPESDPLFWLALAAVLLLPGHWLAARPFLLRLFLRRDEVAEETRQRARELFVEQGVHNTTGRNGVLLFVSLLERRIEVLADTGIHAVAPEGFWDEVVVGLGKAIRQGSVADGLVQSIERCGALMAEHFPGDGRPSNELANEVVVPD